MARADPIVTLEQFDAFISYSRKDIDFARKLDDRLRDLKRKSWADWESLRPGSEFPPRIKAGIEGAANFVFVVSPDSIVSPWCQMELAHAVVHNKRLISILCRGVDAALLPEAIRTIDWIDFERAAFDSALATLVTVIDTDQAWIDGHTRLLVRAIEWQTRSDDSFLLREKELQDANDWLGRASGVKEPRPTQLQLDYIHASQVAQEEERRRWKELSQKYLAGRLAAESKLTREESPRLLSRSVLLATESLNRFPSADGYQALNQALSLLPHPLRRVPHEREVSAVAFSLDGVWFASADQDGVIELLRGEALEGKGSLRHSGRVNALAFSADSRFLAAAGDDHKISVWNLSNMELHRSETDSEAVAAVEFSADGTLLLTATGYNGHPGVTTIREIESGRQVGAISGASISRFYAEGQVVATAEANRLLLRQTASGEVTADLPHDSVITAFDIHRTRPILAVATFDDESLWLWQQGDEGKIFRDHVATGISRIGPVVLSFDGRKVAAAGTDSRIRVWDVDSRGELLQVVHKGQGLRLAFDASGQLLASLSPEDQSVCVWDVETGHRRMCIEQRQARELCFRPGANSLATAGDTNAAWIWSPPTPGAWVWSAWVGLSKSLRFNADGRYLAWTGSRIAPDGKVLVRESGGTLTLLESASGRQLWSFQHEGAIDKVGFSGDGQQVATSAAGAIHVWACASGQELPGLHEAAVGWFIDPESVSGCPEAVVSPDGKLFVAPLGESSGVEREAQVAEVREIASGHALATELRFDGPVTALAWSADSRLLASGHVDGMVRIWEAETGREIARLEQHIDVVPALAFSPGGEWLATCGYDGTVVLWRARPAQLIAEACARLTRNLTLHEWQHYVGDEAYRPTCAHVAATLGDAGAV